MKNKEILLKAMDKARRNGMNPTLVSEARIYTPESYAIKGIIFSHDFAKAFWGTDCQGGGSCKNCSLSCWKFHLQIMVLEKNPLDYIAKFI